MKIVRFSQIEGREIKNQGTSRTVKKVLLGPEEGSQNIVLRHFKILPGGHTPRHKHPYEHLVKIEKGKGIAIDENGEERELSSGNGVFIKPDEEHQFKNPYPEPFEFLCIIPNPEKSKSRNNRRKK